MPLTALMWLATFLVAPVTFYESGRVFLLSLGQAAVLVFFSTSNPLLLGLAWAVSILPLASRSNNPEGVPAGRVAALYLGLSTLALGAGLFLLQNFSQGWGPAAGAACLALAVLTRQGVLPLHSWMPEIFRVGRFAPVLAVCAPQAGAYLFLEYLDPTAPPWLLKGILGLSLAGASLASLLSLTQTNARRSFGWFFASQSSLVLAALSAGSSEGLAFWFASGLGLVGYGLCLWMVELRRGSLDLRGFHGGWNQMPLLSAAFLIFGLACVGFPGTFGFAAEEGLFESIGQAHPLTTLAFVGIAALNAVNVLRMYLHLFCGAKVLLPGMGLRIREKFALLLLSGVLLAGGFRPQWWLESFVPPFPPLNLSEKNPPPGEKAEDQGRMAAPTPGPVEDPAE
jgi:NADH-quinone oxidoreductase subunit M